MVVLALVVSCGLKAFAVSGYSYVRPILIDHRQVLNSDQTDFPLLIGGTFPYLATTVNGGQVQNSSGYDIVFTSDAAGQNQLDHEIDSYNPATGVANFWVRIPLLSHNADTTIYMWYGNSTITSSQENKAGVWRNGYAGVWHFGGSSLSTNDSTTNANNGTNHGGVAATGKFGEAGKFDGTGNTYFDIPSSSSFKPATTITMEAWVNPTAATNWAKVFSLDLQANGSWGGPVYALGFQNTTLEPRIDIGANGTYGGTALTPGVWAHMVGVYDGSEFTVYVNGQQVTAAPQSGPLNYGASKDLAIGVASPYVSGQAMSGLIDEARISTVARSADWIDTEYRNQADPGVFISVCPATAAGGQPAPCSPGGSGSSVSGYSNYEEILVNHLNVPYSDQTDFPVLISGTFSYLATTANGGQVQSASGYDIVFTSDATGLNRLDHEIDSYNPATGAVALWVRVPLLAHGVDTPIYMWYGNSSVSVSQENKPGVWRNGYGGVWHLSNNGSFSVADSTGNNTATISNVTGATGQISGAANFNGSNSSYIRVASSTSIKPATNTITLEAWANPRTTGSTNYGQILDLGYRNDSSWNPPFASYILALHDTAFNVDFAVTTAGTFHYVTTNGAVLQNHWTHVAGVYDGSVAKVYLNGRADASTLAVSGPIDYGTSGDLAMGVRSATSPYNGWDGLMDEVRISSVARSAGWIATEYYNQNAPSSFYAVCPATAVGTAPPACSTNAPVIDAFTPSIAPVATQLQIEGSGFGLTQGSSTVTFSTWNNLGATASVVSWSDSQITVVVPSLAVSGPITVKVGSLAVNSVANCTVPAPQMSSITPNTVGAGNQVTISGSGFQPSPGSGGVVFPNMSGYYAAVSSWSDNQIVAIVPNGNQTGSVQVRAANNQISNGVNFTTPSLAITAVTPYQGEVGTQVTITGNAFGATQGTSTLTFNGQAPASISSWGNTKIVATVPVTATTGPVLVTVNGVNSNVTFSFTVPGPSITFSNPTGGTVGTQVTITGSGFQANQRNSTVTFNGVAATPTSWSDTQIVTTVPPGATTGSLVVTVNGVGGGWAFPFEVPQPVIAGVTPPEAPPGGVVTISGSGFGPSYYYSPDGGNSYISTAAAYLNGTYLSIDSWSDTAIKVVVPGSATSGTLTVTRFDATSNGQPLQVEGLPTVTAISPAFAPVNGTVTITGTGFGSTQSNSSVHFWGGTLAAGPTATVTSWSDTMIVASVPPGTTTGGVSVFVAGQNGPSSNFTLSTTVQVTDSLSNVSTYTSEMLGGTWQSASSTGSGCSSCTVRGTLSNTFDAVGNVLTHTDELNHVTTYTYDSSSNPASQSQPLDSNNTVTTSYTYNSFGEPLTVTDPLGNVTTNTYDANGNLRTMTSPKPDSSTAASVTQFGYDTKGNLTQITDPLNNVTTLAYNSVGLISTITDMQNNVTTYGYDSHGNRTSIIDALQNQTTFSYDAGDRLTKITYPDQTFVSFGYDIRGRRTSVTDQNNKTTMYGYDDADRLTSVTDAANNVTQYGYDTENNLLSITDANNHVTSFQYDNFGRVTKTTFPSTLTETYVYDSVGNLTNKTDRNNNSILYVYDALNRLKHKGYPDSTGIDYVYDLASKIKQVTDPTGTYGMAYDNMGRQIGTTTQYSFLPGTPTFSNTYAYDAGSNRTSLTLPDGSNDTYQYDTLNRLAKITDSATGQFTFGYDALSRRTQLIRPNGVNTNYGYDTLSHLLSILHQSGANTLDGATYTYDNAGNRLSKANQLNGITEQYTYDPLYQLTQVTQGATTTESYSYDPVGNRLSSLGVSSYSYNSSNELTSNSAASFTYDNNGNTLTRTDSAGTRNYIWDYENRLASVVLPGTGGTATFKYDPFGRRIQKTFTQNSTTTVTNFLYDTANTVEELNPSGSGITRYTQRGIDEPFAESRSGTTAFYEQDALSSVTSLSGSSGTISNSYTYDTFGNLVDSVGSLGNPFQFTGRDFDPETGLRYYRARYYDSVIGRFISEDPAQAGNDFYVYAEDNPTGFVDPFGLDACRIAFPVGPNGQVIQFPCPGKPNPAVSFCVRYPLLCALALPLLPQTAMNHGNDPRAMHCADVVDLTCPNQGKRKFKFTLIPLEIVPPGTAKGRPAGPCKVDDDGGDDGDCPKLWTEAYRKCAELITERGPKSLRGNLGGSGVDLEHCARGFVPQRCGGTRIDWGPQGPPR
jgi:RHS repeat-associated protein